MAVSKVILNDETLMDVTQDSVTASTLLEGETATGADGVRITGTATAGGGTYIKPFMSEYMLSGNSFVYNGTDLAHLMAEASPGDAIRISTSNYYFLNAITREDTSASVPFTVISTSSRGGEYSFTMPDASVTFDLYYSD